MSRIGKRAVPVPEKVDVTLKGQTVAVKGPKGELSLTMVDEVTVSKSDDGIEVAPRDDSKRARSMWGMQRTLISNLIEGVSEGFKKDLELRGTGYRAQMKGKAVELKLGLSHDVVYQPPAGIDLACASQTEISISGIDKQVVGQVAAKIRSFRPPEPYKGKGIRYKDEYVLIKEGKKK